MTVYQFGRATTSLGLGVSSLLKSGPRPALFGFRYWATTYDGVGITGVPEVRLNLVRDFENYPQYLAARTIARFTAQAEEEFGAGRFGFLRKVQNARLYEGAGHPLGKMFYGSAIEAIVNEMVTLDPLFDNPDFFVQGRLNLNTRGNPMKPDFALLTGEDIAVFDITSPGEAGKVGKYSVATTAVDVLTGTSRSSVGPSATNLAQFHHLLDD